jgi:hypothetical protein
MQEVGGSIPPGSTNLRSLHELRLVSQPSPRPATQKKPPIEGGFFVVGIDRAQA